jgi:Uri superfamily endonuclease
VYVYFGGAYGPGGLAARLGRHLRGGGRRHWHVDHLRAEAEVLGAAVWPGGGECAWRAAVQDTGGAGVPWPRFGSSDCRRCPAHLLSLDETVEPVAAVVRLGVRAARSHLGDGPTKDVSPDQKGRWPHAISAHDGPHP